jgi:methanogenic corrinoid protein MtbC1
MIRWCAYCQRFLGEVEPLDDYAITHTICEACAAREAYLLPQSASLEAIQAFFMRVAQAGAEPGPTAREIVAQGAALGLDPVDLLVGVMQPVLRRIGERWARSQATIAEEHRVSALCSMVIQTMLADDASMAALREARPPTVLLTVAEGNHHTLGIQVLEVVLLRHRIATYTVYPGLPAPEVVALARALRPRVIAISAAVPEQLGSAAAVAEQLADLPPGQRPRVVVGGRGLHDGAPLPAGNALLACRDARALLELVRRGEAARP